MYERAISKVLTEVVMEEFFVLLDMAGTGALSRADGSRSLVLFILGFAGMLYFLAVSFWINSVF